MEDFNPKKMKVAELREALAQRNLSVDGVKKDLIARLEEALDREAFGGDDGDMPEGAESGSPDAGDGEGSDEGLDNEDEGAEDDEGADDDDEGDDEELEGSSPAAAAAAVPESAAASAAHAAAAAAAPALVPAPVATAAASAGADEDKADDGRSPDMKLLEEALARAEGSSDAAKATRIRDQINRLRRAERFGVKPKETASQMLAKLEGRKPAGKGAKGGKPGAAADPKRNGKRPREEPKAKPAFKNIEGGLTVDAAEEAKRLKRMERFGKTA